MEEAASVDETFEIQITKKIIDHDEVNAVNARELWERLGVKTDFSDWIKGRIVKYGFMQGIDYLLLKKKEQVPHQGGMRSVEKIDYFISLDMAKELSMVENNEQGKCARRYFIQCEKIAKGEIQKFEHGAEPIATLATAQA